MLTLLLVALACAGQPGSGDPVVSIEAIGGRESGHTYGALWGGRGRVDVPVGLYAEARVIGVRGLDQDLVDAVLALDPDPEATEADLPPTTTIGARAVVDAGWQLGQHTRQAGPRAEVGLRLGWEERVGRRRWFGATFANSALFQGDQVLHVGPSGRVGWALPIGEAVGDPLLTVHLAGWLGAPIVAWGNVDGWEDGEPRATLDTAGLRSLASLERFQGALRVDIGFSGRRLALGASPYARWWTASAASRRLGFVPTDERHVDVGVRLSIGLVI